MELHGPLRNDSLEYWKGTPSQDPYAGLRMSGVLGFRAQGIQARKLVASDTIVEVVLGYLGYQLES